MIFALMITPLFAILAIGDVPSALATIQAEAPSKLDMFKGLDFIAIISLLGWGLGYSGQPHILVRFLAADSVKSIPKARLHQYHLDDSLSGWRRGNRLFRDFFLLGQSITGWRRYAK